MSIQYPVRVSFTDETLIVDRNNVEVATTFFGQEDYDAEYKHRAARAAFIVECLNERAALTARIKALEGALSDLVSVCERTIYPKPDVGQEHPWHMLTRARSALAKKEG